MLKQLVRVEGLMIKQSRLSSIITHMKKLLDSDWLRAAQSMSSTTVKRVIPVHKA